MDTNILKDLKSLADNIPYTLWIKDLNGRYMYTNHSYESLLNKPSEKIIGFDDSNIYSKNYAAKIKNEDIYMEANNINRACFAINDNCNQIAEVLKIPLKNYMGEVKAIGGLCYKIRLSENIYHDIAVQFPLIMKNDNESLKASKNLLNNIENLSQTNGVFILLKEQNSSKDNYKLIAGDCSPNLLCEDVNIALSNYPYRLIKGINIKISNSFVRKCIIKNESEININDIPCLNKYFRENVKLYVYPIIFNDSIGGFFVICLHKDKKINEFQKEKIKNIFDLLKISIQSDIEKNALNLEYKKLNNSENDLKLFLELAMDYCLLIENKNSKLIHTNISKSLLVNLGYTKNQFISLLNNESIIHPEDIEKRRDLYPKIIKNNELKDVIIRYLSKHNEYIWIKWNLKYYKYCNKIACTGDDITHEIKFRQKKLHLQKAIMLENYKTGFFAKFSNRFCTELDNINKSSNALYHIVKNSEYCKMTNLKKFSEYLEVINQNTYRILKIVNNIKETSLSDNSNYKLNLKNCNIIELIKKIISYVSFYFWYLKRDFTFESSDDEIILACDPQMIEKIILNLLSNSIKNTKEYGKIKMCIKKDKTNNLVITVLNDGNPILEEDKESIFKRFVQAENLYTRSHEGTGIGLYIVRSLVLLHNGSIYADTNVKNGAKFVINLPIKLLKDKNIYNITENSTLLQNQFDIEFSDIL